MREDRPSGTACLIALALLALSGRREGRRLVPDDMVTMLRAGLRGVGGTLRVLAFLAPRRVSVPVVRLLERSNVPGVVTHFALRKRIIEGHVRAAVGEGCLQVVVIAAGLDVLSVLLCRSNPGVRVIEIDHPATQRAKRRFLGAAGVREGELSLVPADLGRVRASEALCASGVFDPAAPTVFVLEGLTMYLECEQVQALLRDLSTLVPRARLVVTFMEPAALGVGAFARQGIVLRALLGAFGERFRCGVPRGEFGAFLARAGWEVEAVAGAEEFQGEWARAGCAGAMPRFVGEFVVIARR